MNLPRSIGFSLDACPEDLWSFAVWRTTTAMTIDDQDYTSSRFHLAVLGITLTLNVTRYGNHLPPDTDFDIDLGAAS